MVAADDTEKIQRLELLQEIIHDMITELDDPGMKEILPNQTKPVGMVIIGQFRRRESPEQIETINIRYGDPIYLGVDGQTNLSPAKEDDFPEALDFNIYPSL